MLTSSVTQSRTALSFLICSLAIRPLRPLPAIQARSLNNVVGFHKRRIISEATLVICLTQEQIKTEWKWNCSQFTTKWNVSGPLNFLCIVLGIIFLCSGFKQLELFFSYDLLLRCKFVLLERKFAFQRKDETVYLVTLQRSEPFRIVLYIKGDSSGALLKNRENWRHGEMGEKRHGKKIPTLLPALSKTLRGNVTKSRDCEGRKSQWVL